MLHVILLILKIVLLILAGLLGLALLVLFLALFVPVRYRAYVKKKETFLAEAKITWLFPCISVPVSFRDRVFQAKVRIFGIPVLNLAENKEAVYEDAAEFYEEAKTEVKKEVGQIEKSAPKPENDTASGETSSRTEHEGKEEAEPETECGEAEEGEEAGPGTERVEFEESEESEESEPKRGFFDFLKRILRIFQGISGKLKNLKCTILRFCDRIKQMRKKYADLKRFAFDERTKAAVSLSWEQLCFLLRKLLPGKIRGELRFGTEDPALTGRILGAVSIFYPLFMDNVKVEPDFCEPVLEGELFVKGGFRLIHGLRAAWKLFRDRNVRYVYRRLNR